MTAKQKAAKRVSSRARKMKANRSGMNIRNFIAGFSANRHLYAYLLDRNPKHIAAAWIDFRRFKLKPDETVLLWIDCLADAVLNPPAAKVRPPKDTARNLDIWRKVQILRDKKGVSMTTPIYGEIGQPYGLSAGAVKMIVSRVQETIDDPDKARAFRK